MIKPTRYQQQNYEYKLSLEKKMSKTVIHKTVGDYKNLIEKYSKTTEFYLYKYTLIPANRITPIINTPITAWLENKILEQGFSTNILVKADKAGIAHLDYGFEELAIAQKHNLLIPAVVLDHENIFEYSFPIKNTEELKTFIPVHEIKTDFKKPIAKKLQQPGRKLKYAKRNMS